MDGPRTESDVAEVLDLLEHGTIDVQGRIADASNVALLVEVAGRGTRQIRRAIYKPVRGERPLWDFPDGTLAGREVASWLLATALGYGVVPPTVLREGPYGTGSLQEWVGDPFADGPDDLTPVVRVVPVGQVPPGWLAVIDGELGGGRAVTVVHEDAADVRGVAVLDAVLNNSDRKGSHLVRDSAGVLWGFDHGLTLHEEPKLRTVLWGWAGQSLREEDLVRLDRLASQLGDEETTLRRALEQLLPRRDVQALLGRTRRLVRDAVHPLPGRGWPSIPWPAL
ncbi:MAG: SCO1664 family protein [Dermatophilaceae bacterium]